jgi:hypothetical protein
VVQLKSFVVQLFVSPIGWFSSFFFASAVQFGCSGIQKKWFNGSIQLLNGLYQRFFG